MKLKMAEKSLFAILLRSPWWISFCLVAVFVLASKALLPSQYFVFGALGGFPFLVIGCVAAWRQSRAPSAQRVEEALGRAAAMSWRDFADALESGYKRDGFQVARLNAGAADFKLEKGGQVTLVSARRWKAANQGAEPLRDLVALKAAHNADHLSFVSLSAVTGNAMVFARQNSVSLIADTNLAALIST